MAGPNTRFEQAVTRRLSRLAAALPEPLRSPLEVLVARPGKRLRSALLAACANHGEAVPDRLCRAGALVELLHIASLLHDDVVDRAPIRRGAATAHTTVGPELALLSGLACFALVGSEAAELGTGVSVAVGRTAATLSYGQLLDVERAFDTELSIEDYLELVAGKTAALFSLCCRLGATEAQADSTVVRGLTSFGNEVGIAFQILDDCLDIEPGDSGKPAGMDQLLGLFGAPTLFALRADASHQLRDRLLSPKLQPTDLPSVRALVSDLGGVRRARRLAHARYRVALDTLDGLPGPAERRAAVLAVVEPMWSRRW